MKKIAVLSGDGIGPEVMAEALRVLRELGDFEFSEALIGGAAWDECAEHFPDATRRVCEESDAILFGSVGGPVDKQMEEKWRGCETNSILALRKAFGFNVNLRPVRSEKIDLMCVRELSSGIYFGEHVLEDDRARDVMEYTYDEIEAVTRAAFDCARGRDKRLVSVDKANVLACSKLWRRVVETVAEDYPDVKFEHILVDNCAMQIVRAPEQFDVLLMPNMFGDILSDAASVYAGSLGMLPSASLNREGFGMYEPSGGSAPDIAGKGIANPIGMIVSAAMMLKYSFKMDKEYEAILRAIDSALRAGVRTRDLGGSASTSEMGDAIIQNLTN